MGVKCAKDHSCLHFKIVEHEFLGNQTETCVAFTLHLHSHSLSSVSVTTLPDVWNKYFQEQADMIEA